MDYKRHRQWRFPSEALLDTVCQSELKTAIVENFQNNTGSVPSPGTVWEAFKAYTRGVCISKSSGILKAIRARLTNLENKICNLEFDMG